MSSLLKDKLEYIWNNTAPAAGTNVDYALPATTRYLGVSLYFPGTAPGAITLNIQGSIDGAANSWVTEGTLNSVAGPSDVVVDMAPYKFVRFNLATHTTPQNIVVGATPRV